MNIHPTTAMHPLVPFLKTILIVSLLFGGLATSLTSCANCWGGGRRPPIYTVEYPYYIDFMPSDWDEEEEKEKECMELGERECEENIEALRDPHRPVIDEYHIAVGDILEISVFGDQDTMVENTIVAPDGRIYYLFMEGILAEGKTIEALRMDIEEKLADMFLAPNVSVIPRLMSKNNFTILGRVRRPGMFPLNQAITIRQGIGIAGGLVLQPEFIAGDEGSLFINSYQSKNNNTPNLQNSFIVRDGKRLNIDFQKLVFSGDASQDIILKPGDYMYIASNLRREVYVLGAVASPTAITYDDRMTLMKALAYNSGWRSGGPTGADMQNVLILRGELDCPEVIRVDLFRLIRGEARDIFLQPGDVVYVHNKKFRFGRELVQMAVTTFIQSFVNSAAIDFSNHVFSSGAD